MRVMIAIGLFCLGASIAAATPPDEAKKPEAKKTESKKNEKGTPRPAMAPKEGIKTPGIQIPFESVKAEAAIPVETPGWITIGDAVFIPNKSKDILLRVDAKTNKTLDPVANLAKPCSGTLVAFGSLWIPNCGAQTVTRFDTKTNKVTATLATGTADVMMGLAATADSVWILTDSKTTLSRIDPVQNEVVGELRLPADCNSVTFGEGSLWVTCPSESRLLRIDPRTNLVDKRIDVSPGPRSVAFGAASVWVLCEKDGKVERIDPKTNKVIKTIELSVAHAGGNIAFGEGYVWVTQTGFPLTRIDPQTEKERVVQQFWGEGGGLLTVAPGAIWLSNIAQGTVSRLDPKRVIATLAE
jgi:DNA-binding beta-propeller fold protein YncE